VAVELTRDLDPLKAEVDGIALVMRLRSAPAPAAVQGEEAAAGESEHDGP